MNLCDNVFLNHCLLDYLFQVHILTIVSFLCDLNFADKVVVGSYMGMLRIFSPHASKASEGGPADTQLLEVQLQNAIIQVELGKFVS